MKKFLLFLAILASSIDISFAAPVAGAGVERNAMTTNGVIGIPTSGQYPQWNGSTWSFISPPPATAATLSRLSSFTILTTNFHRAFTNWEFAVATNLETVITGTNGFIRVTNTGMYEVSMAVTYNSITNPLAMKTNQFVITTNLNFMGTNSTEIGFTGTTMGMTNYFSGAASGLILLNSNTYVGLAHRQINNVGTNNLNIVSAFLTVKPISRDNNTIILATNFTITTNIGGTSTNLTGNILWVDSVYGDNATAAADRGDLPYLTLTAAKNAASAGDTIVVRPGSYSTGPTNLLKNLVNWHFESGAVLSNRFSAAGHARAIFDDRGIGAINCKITGLGTFIAHMTNAVANSDLMGGILVLTNPASNIQISGARAEGWAEGITATSRDGTLFRIENAGTVHINFDEVIGPEYSPSVAPEAGVNGILWVRGDVWMRVRKMKVEGYGVWGEAPQSDMLGTTNDLYYEGDSIVTTKSQAIFFSMSNYTHRAWVRSGEIRTEAAPALSTIALQDGGRVYIQAEKIGGTNVAQTIAINRLIAGSPGVQAWITSQKVSADTQWLSSANAADIRFDVDHWEDEKAVANGLDLLSGKNTFFKGDFAVKNGTVVTHTSGTNTFIACRLDSIGTNLTASVVNNITVATTDGSSNLIFQATSLFSPIKVPTHAGAKTMSTDFGTSTIEVYGSLTCNTNVSGVNAIVGNITTNQYIGAPIIGFIPGANITFTTNAAGEISVAGQAGAGGGPAYTGSSFTPLTFDLIGSASSTVTMYGTNQQWKLSQTSNVTFAVSALTNYTPYRVIWTNSLYTIAWPATFRWTDGITMADSPALSNGTYIVDFWVDNHGTNARVTSGPPIVLKEGWNIALVTNAVNGTVTYTTTNRVSTVATNATTMFADFSDTANVQVYNLWWHLVTNLVIAPTNFVTGRILTINFDTNSLSYNITITNAAANPVRWNFNVPTNGTFGVVKTNTLRAKLLLTAETNGTITADFGYYR